MSRTTDTIEEVFRRLNNLLKTGEFTKHDLVFMKIFLESCLATTNKLLEKVGKKS
jgi:hypothetical protein